MSLDHLRFRLLLSSFLVVLCTSAGAADADVRVVRVPDGGIHPQAAVDGRGRLHLVYFKGDAAKGDALYVRSDDGGKTFTKPVRVNSQPGAVIIAGTVRGPHLSVGRGDRVHVAWMGSSTAQPRLEGNRAPMLYTRTNDAGDAFERERNVIGSHPGLDGGGSVAADAEGHVYVAWHAPADATAEGEEGRRVWITRSADDGKTFDAETVADADARGVCACCGMRVFAGGKGRVVIAYRAATKVVNRDLRLLVSDDGGKAFRVATEDAWQVAKCVMSTSAFARKDDGGVLAAWETKEQIRVATLSAGTVKAEPQSLPGMGKNRKHPALAVNARGESLVAWTEGTAWKAGGDIAWQAYGRDGRPIADRAGRAAGLPAWGLPAVTALNDGSFLVVY